MSWVGGIVLFVMLWTIVFLCLLPIGTRTQEDSGKIVAGTPASAPETLMLLKKILWATIITFCLWLVIFLIAYFDVISLADLPEFGLPS